MNLTIQAGGIGDTKMEQNAVQKANGTQKKTGNVYGGTLKLAEDPIAEKRKMGQERAWKVVSDAWKNDRSVEDSIKSRREHYAAMEQQKKEALSSLVDTEQDMKAVKELYGVTDDSEEQKDLELLKKRQDFENKVSVEKPTEEEYKKLAEIDKKSLTEYQTRQLELNERAGKFKMDAAEAERQMRDDDSDIRGIEKELLKSHGMVDAQKSADAILAATNDEIVGMLVQEATEHIDETAKEAEEKADEKLEEKEEREEQLDEIKEQRAMEEALIAGTKEAVEKAKAQERQNDTPQIETADMVAISKGGSQTDDVKQSLDDIKSSMRLLEADLKGIKVDQEV